MDSGLAFGLIFYLVIMLGIGFYTFARMRSLDDFVLGGRSLGPWVTAISERVFWAPFSGAIPIRFSPF